MGLKFFAFPGQGSQYAGMGKDWFENFKEAQLVFEEASDATSLPLKKLCFDGSDSDLAATEITQPAILTCSVAMYRSLESMHDLFKVSKECIFAGHSLGEYSALVAGKILTVFDGARLVHQRGKLMTEACPRGLGAMSALLFKPKSLDTFAKAQEICDTVSKKSQKICAVANLNTAEQIVVSGHQVALDLIPELAKEPKYDLRKVVPLSVSGPFHSPLMQKAADGFAIFMDKAQFKSQSNFRYYANVDAQEYDLSQNVDGLKERLKNQITGSVLWATTIEKVIQSGNEMQIEVGPGAALSGMAKRIEWQGKTLKPWSVDRFDKFREDFKNVQAEL